MSHIRVAIVELPRMLQDIVVSMLASESDIELVHADAALDERTDVAILNLDGIEHFDLLQDMLAANPKLRIVAIAADGRRIALYDLRPHRTPLGELSAAGLVALVRQRGHAVEIERNWMRTST